MMEPALKDEQRRAGLHPPRYSLRTMLAVTAVVGMGLATMRWLGPIWTWALLLTAAAVGAHVAGNVIGCRLRDQGQPNPRSRRRPARAAETDASSSYLRGMNQIEPPSQLRHRHPLGLGLLLVSLLAGILGGCIGAVVLMRVNPESASIRALVFGAIASGLLSGLWVFWMLSLIRVAFAAWWEAHRHSVNSGRRVH